MKARFLLIPVLALSLAGCGYNHIQDLDERVNELQGNIQAELLRRNDLIPNLVATVQEAAAFEKSTFTRVAEARSGLSQARQKMADAVQGKAGPQQLSQADAAVADRLRLFLNVAVEAYPTLQANQNFRALQDELTETENRLAVARRDYNEAVRQYNSYVRKFPQVLTARAIGAKRREPFQAPASAEQAPKVQFQHDSSTE
ncbi:MAG TPA: LemA family protein [Longimicrobiales bacterium]|nr:LemA family protein [Longimicrobiales bacterium]